MAEIFKFLDGAAPEFTIQFIDMRRQSTGYYVNIGADGLISIPIDAGSDDWNNIHRLRNRLLVRLDDLPAPARIAAYDVLSRGE